MSDGAEVTLKADISDIEKKAAQIPDIVDREARKGKSKKFGDFTQGYTEVTEGKLKTVSTKTAMERTGYEQREQIDARKKQEREQKDRNDDYVKRVKFNTGVQALKDKQAQKELDQENARKKKAEEEQKRSDERDARERRKYMEKMANAKDWSDQFVDIIGKGLLRTVGPWAVAIKAFQYAVEAAKEGLDRMRSTAAVTNVYGTDPQKLFNLQTAARKVGSDPEEITGIVTGLQQRMARGALGLDPEGVKAISILRTLGMDISNEKVAAGAVDAADAVSFLADKYGDLTKSQEGAMWASQIFGEEYVKLIPLMREGSEGIKRLGGEFEKSQSEIQGERDISRKMGTAWEWLTGWTSTFKGGSKESRAADLHEEFQDYLAQNIEKPWDETIRGMFKPVDQGGLMQPGETKQELDKRIREMFQVVKGRAATEKLSKMFDPMIERYEKESAPLLADAKKVKGGGIPTLAIASSLQAMGGGDFASAINRGPVDMIAENTKATAEAARETANNTKNLAPGAKVQQPAVIGK